MRSEIILLIFLFAGTSCHPGFHSMEVINYCYNDSLTTLSNKLNLNGYFSEYEVLLHREGGPSYAAVVNDTVSQNVVFYPDGTILYQFYPKEFLNNEFGYEGGMGMWGIYEFENDTIKAHILTSGKSWPATPFAYVWFELIDATTIKEICFKWDEPITPVDVIKYLENPSEIIVSRSTGEYVPYDSLPDPNKAWIKKRKWFWCDKDQYQEWKENHKIR